jgi:hypothetical protein
MRLLQYHNVCYVMLCCQLLYTRYLCYASKSQSAYGIFVLRVRNFLRDGPLMLYSEINAVCSENHTKHVSTLCGQNVELLNVKLVVHIVTTVRYVYV